MRKLHHFWLSAGSRQARLVLGEKKIPFELMLHYPWQQPEALLQLTPSCDVPVLEEKDGNTICGTGPICEYLDEAFPDPSLIGRDLHSRAEVRRLVEWFNVKFDQEVTRNLVTEKLIKRLSRQGQPYAQAIRAGHNNIHYHLDYIGWLTQRRNWLAGNDFSMADIAAGAHVSCIDYLGDIPWEKHPEAKDWYQRIKSRPAFRDLLKDTIAGAMPPDHYADLDF